MIKGLKNNQTQITYVIALRKLTIHASIKVLVPIKYNQFLLGSLFPLIILGLVIPLTSLLIFPILTPFFLLLGISTTMNDIYWNTEFSKEDRKSRWINDRGTYLELGDYYKQS